MKMKKLLASALAAAMVISSMVGTLVTSAAETVGTITAGTVNAVVGETDTVAADINIAFPNGVVAPHNIITVALDGYNLSEVALGTVTYAEGSAEGVVSIDADGSNLAAGKILLECPVDSKAPTVTAIALTATFVDADETDTVAGTYAIVVSGDDMTDVNEADIAIDAINGSLVVAEPHVCSAGAATSNNDGTHDIACAGCDKLFADNEACNYVDGACSVCGYAEPVTGPVLDENLQFRDVVVTVTSTVNIRYRLYKKTKDGINGYQDLGYDHVEVVVSGKEYSFDTANLYNEVDIPETIVNMTANNNTGNTFLYEGISMCSLGLNINAYIKAYDAEGNYVAYSPLKESSPELLIKETLENTTTVNGKTAFTELLNMAAAAQVQFAANKAGTDLAAAVAADKLVNKGLDDTYTISDLPELNTVEDVQTVEGYADFIASHKVSASVALTQSPNIKVFVGGRDTLDISKLKVVFSYYDPDPTVKKNVEKVIDGSTAEGAAAIGVSGKRYTFEVPGFEFHNSNQTVTATVYYDVDGDGTLEAVSVAQYSIETYVSTTLASTSATQIAKDMATAIAKFGLAFRNNKGITA